MMFRFLAVTLATVLIYANANAQAPTVAWETQSKTILVTPQSAGLTQSFTMEIPQVMRWVERVEKIRMEPRTFEEIGICEGLQCSENGSGKSPAWDRYFSAPKAEKPQALDAAIKGVGPVSAQALIATGYFTAKPRSWSAFVGEIDRAANKHVITNSVRYDVAVKYRAENAENLGYQQSSCTTYTYQCMRVVTRDVPVPYYFEEPRSKTLQTYVRYFAVTAVNPKIQYFENDTVTVTAGQELSNVQVSAGPFTQYVFKMNHEGNLTNILLTGTTRNFVRLPGEVVQGAFVVKSGTGVALNVTVDGRYLPAQQGADRLQVNYVVETCPLNFLGGCGFHPWKVVDQGESVLNAANALISLKGVEYKDKVRVRYSLARRGSSWYDGSNTAERTTPEFKNNN